MLAQSRSTQARPPATAQAAPQPEVRHAVRDLLLASPSFQQLPAATQQQVAHDMTRIADYLVRPEGIPGNQLPTATALDDGPQADPQLAASNYAQDSKAVDAIGKDQFRAGALREGVREAGALMKAVNFPDFVSGLIQGVFHAIVSSSIGQTQAYAELVKSVAQSLNQFRDENVSQAQGDDHLLQQFPDIFQMGQSNDPFSGGSGQACNCATAWTRMGRWRR